MNQKWFHLVLSTEVEMGGVHAALLRVLSDEYNAALSRVDLRPPGTNAGLLTVARNISITERRPR